RPGPRFDVDAEALTVPVHAALVAAQQVGRGRSATADDLAANWPVRRHHLDGGELVGGRRAAVRFLAAHVARHAAARPTTAEARPVCCPGIGTQRKQSLNPVTESPFTVSCAPVTSMPSTPFPASVPSSRTVMTALSPWPSGRVSGVAPGCELPSMTVEPAPSAGSARRGWIVHTAGVPVQPAAVAGIWNSMVSPEPSAFALVMAQRSENAPT